MHASNVSSTRRGRYTRDVVLFAYVQQFVSRSSSQGVGVVRIPGPPPQLCGAHLHPPHIQDSQYGRVSGSTIFQPQLNPTKRAAGIALSYVCFSILIQSRDQRDEAFLIKPTISAQVRTTLTRISRNRSGPATRPLSPNMNLFRLLGEPGQRLLVTLIHGFADRLEQRTCPTYSPSSSSSRR